MIKFENIETSGWEAAIRGMRNPMNSWKKSDSYWQPAYTTDLFPEDFSEDDFVYILGDNDLDLAKRLAAGGPVHGKFKRMIIVTLDITAPLYWWKEFDTYKVGTVANSCSTMHKIHAKEFTLEDFSCEHLISLDETKDILYEAKNFGAIIVGNEEKELPEDPWVFPKEMLVLTIRSLNRCRDLYLETKDKRYWWQMIQLLPTSYNQKRTVMLNYEVLTNIYHYRKNHKLDEWHDFCDMIRGLPYAKELITENIYQNVD